MFPTLRVGETHAPSSAATVAPSPALEAIWRDKLDSVLVTMSATQRSDTVQRSTYSEILMSAGNSLSNVVGSCNNWRRMILSDLPTSQLQYKPTEVCITAQEQLEGSESTICCSNATSIVLSLISASTSVESFDCGGHSWAVAQCTASSTSAVCVDCADPCDVSAHCTAATIGSTSLLKSVSPFTVAPCETTVCTETEESQPPAALRVVNVAFTASDFAPTLLSIKVSATKSTLAASVKLDRAGTVYCAAYQYDPLTGTTFIPSSTSTIALQNFVASSNAQNVSNVLMSELKPGTDYEVYCMSSSLAGTTLALDQVLAKSVTASTSCCIPVTAQSAASTVKEGLNVRGFLALSVSARPATEVVLTLSATTEHGVPVTPSPFFPSTFTISALQQGANKMSTLKAQDALALSASLTALPAGNYVYNMTITGQSSKQFSVSFINNANTIKVLSTEQPLPAPVLTSAVFADDGSYIAITFNSNTDKANGATQFMCNALFSFSCASTSSCVWVSSKQVNAYVSSSSGCAAIGSPISVAPTATVKALCQAASCDTSLWPSVQSSVSINVASPSSAISPVVSISAQIGRAHV